MSDESDDLSPGWDAISGALESLYPGQEPRHFGTVISYQLGGSDPLDGISVYRSEESRPHWHFVTFGFSELYAKESTDPDVSGYGFELTFRLACATDASEPPMWALNFLQNLARYVFKTGNVFEDGHWMTANGPIALNENTPICSMGFAEDPRLLALDTPNGRLKFIQVVGLTAEEEEAAKRWSTRKLLDVLLPFMPLWITDLHRESLMSNSAVATQVMDGLRVDGSSQGYTYVDVLRIDMKKRLLRKSLIQVTLGARQVAQLHELLPLRLPFGRPFTVAGPEFQLVFQPAGQSGVAVDGAAMTIALPSITEFLRIVQAKEGRYQMAGLDEVEWHIQKTLITNPEGEVVATYG
ncbi:suppressor of fused domain protein [Duganella radicis]|uniref:Suppressor of fused domain protein n=1 Tax=Duganella radicis TaxID=551988 RepID=A0A6L6PS82_9BURK|nr:suppressor of fused domain protein [Duganella radicis]MTV41712.1 suppressor of fused domain protein [Duganella radicis]